MKKLLIVIGLFVVSITCVKAQLFMHLGSSDSVDVLGLIVRSKGFNDSVKPDLYIDSVKYDSKILDMIDPGKIGSINVMKGEAAIKEYNAPNGAIFITSKAATGKSGNPNEIRLRATGNFNSSDRAISVHRLSDEEFNKMVVDAKDRVRATGNIDSLDRTISVRRLSDEEFNKMVVDEKARVISTGNIDSLDRAISVHSHRLSNEEAEKIIIFEQSKLLGNIGNIAPVIIIDGKVSSQEELSKLSPFDVESIKIVKGDEAMEKYNAPNAAIIVETKKKKE